MSSQQNNANARRLILSICVVLFTGLLVFIYQYDPSYATEARQLSLKEQSAYDAIAQENKDYQEQIHSLRKEIEQLTFDRESFGDESLEKKVEDLEDFIQAREQDREDFEIKLAELAEIVNEKDDEIEHHKDQILVLTEQIEQQRELYESLAEKREALERSEEIIARMEGSLHDKKQQFEQLVRDVPPLKVELEEKKARLQLVQTELLSLKAQMNERIEEIEDERDSALAKLKETQDELDELDILVGTLHGELNDERDQKEKLNAEIASLHQETEEALVQLEEFEIVKSDLEEKEIQLQDSEDELVAARNTINGLNQRLKQKDEMFSANLQIEEEKKQQLREHLSDLEHELAILRDEVGKIPALQEQIKLQHQEFDVVQNDLEKSDESLRILQNDYSDVKAAYAAIEQEKQTLLKALEENAGTIEELERQFQQQNRKWLAEVQNEREKQSELTKRMQSAEERNQQLQARVDGLQTELKIQNEKVNDLLVFERKFEEERKKRMIKEQVLKQLQAHLQHQKRSLSEIETHRQTLNQELEETQQSYSQLAKELAKRKPAPGIVENVVINEPQQHIVRNGETLMHISKHYYGTTKKWRRILEANRETISDENQIRPGTLLAIP